MRSEATTVEEYLGSLEESRREQMVRTLDFVRPALPDGLDETMEYGMITWVVPLSVAPDTYNGKPLAYAALASQKNHISLYLMGLYAQAAITEDEFRTRWAGAKRLNLGKSCVRFTSVDAIDVPLIVEVLEGLTTVEFAQRHNDARR